MGAKTIKQAVVLSLALCFGGSSYAAEQTNSNNWRWAELNGIGERWNVREGTAKVEMNAGKIRAELMMGSGGDVLYEISGTYRLGRAGNVQDGTVDASVTTKGSDYGNRIPYKGTYMKAVIPAELSYSLGKYRETIILGDGTNAIGLMKTTR